MVRIFISHSRKDIALVNKIYRACSRVEIIPEIAEFKPEVKSPPYQTIHEMMVRSQACAIFITPNVKQTDYTTNWILYEVGLAHGMNKPVYVFEEKQQTISFPIPYLTELILYDSEEERSETDIETALSEITSRLRPSPALARGIIGAMVGEAIAPGSGLMGFLLGASTTPQEVRPYSRSMICPYQDCRITHILTNWHAMDSYKCPACRRGIRIV